MPREISNRPPVRSDAPETFREMARRARRLAQEIILDQEARSRLIEFAEELDAKAATLETTPQTFSHDEAVVVQKDDPDRK